MFHLKLPGPPKTHVPKPTYVLSYPLKKKSLWKFRIQLVILLLKGKCYILYFNIGVDAGSGTAMSTNIMKFVELEPVIQ